MLFKIHHLKIRNGKMHLLSYHLSEYLYFVFVFVFAYNLLLNILIIN